jgi:hypothetical protein
MFNGRNFQKLMILHVCLAFPVNVVNRVIMYQVCSTEQWLKLTSYCEGDV